MNDLTGINREATRFQSYSENGSTASLVGQNIPPLYDQLVQQSYANQLPSDSNSSTLPQLKAIDDKPGADLNDLYDRFNQTSDSFEVGLTEIFTVLHEAAVSLKKTMKEVRAAEREVQQAKLQDAADKLKNAATFAMVSGIVGGSMQAVGGAISIGGAVASGRTAMGKTSELNMRAAVDDTLDIKPSEPMKIADLPLEQRISLAQVRSGKWTGASQVVGGVGQATSAIFEGQSKSEESQKAELDAEATKAQAAVDDSNQLVQDLAEMVRDVRAKLSEIESANNETIRKTLQV